ncbi:MAG: hypothetical protein ABJF01_01900 [bacterium]
MASTTLLIRSLLAGVALTLVAGRAAHAQAAPSKPAHPAVCAQGVRVFTEKREIPVPYDTLTMPPADGPVRISSPEEAEAAELAVRGRAGSVGATAILISDETSDEGGGTRVRRTVTALYVPADAARAQQACKKS